MTVTNASTGTHTSSWRMELIPSVPLRTKMDLVLTTSAGQEKTNRCIQSADNSYKRMLTHVFCDTETQMEIRCPGASSEEAAGCCGTTVM